MLPSATSSIIPANVLGATNMTINTSQINFASQSGGVMFGYSGTPGAGNLFFSLSPNGGQDQFGNPYGAGITANSGLLNGVSIIGAILDATTTLQGSSLQAPQVINPAVTGGVTYSMTHTFMNSAGQVLGYTSGTTAATFATNGTYQWTCPTGITQVRVQCWGAGGGGDGGTPTQGGAGGGAGEYGEEPGYQVTPGQVYTVVIGQGGSGGDTGSGGSGGGQTNFFPALNPGGLNVIGNGGGGGAENQSGVGGQGGFGSPNTIHFAGGNGANVSGSTGGDGGGSSGGPASQGNGGNQSSSATGAAGGAAVSGGGAGGNGGNNDVNGSAGSGPGGGGGGAGAGNVVSQVRQYQPTAPLGTGTYSYYGADANSNPPLTQRDHDGPLYQGNYAGGGIPLTHTPGNQFSYFSLPYTLIQSQLAGATVTSVVIHIKCLASLGGNLSCYLQYSNAGSFGNIAPSDTKVHVKTFTVAPGSVAQVNLGLGGGIGTALQSGSAKSICIGPGPSEFAPYSGYFDSGANNGYTPSIFVYFYTGTPTVQGGAGADGKCVITYASSTPAFQLAISSVSSTDVYGYGFQPGFTGPQLNLTAQASAPASTTATAIISANTAGTPQVSLPSGMNLLIPAKQVDTTAYTVTTASFSAISKAWTVPSSDAQAATAYRVRAFGHGQQGATATSLVLQVSAFGAQTGKITFPATDFIASQFFAWQYEAHVVVATAGVSGTAHMFSTGTVSEFIVASDSGQPPSDTICGQDTGKAINTTTSNSITIQAEWGSTASAPTITSYSNIFERLGS